MVDPYYSKLLDIPPDASVEQMREAYHRQAKKNHPDLFPEEHRPLQQLKMMRINVAYMELMAHLKGSKAKAIHHKNDQQRPSSSQAGVRQRENQVGFPKDPAYAYYKRGFLYFRRGYSELFRKDPKLLRRHPLKERLDNGYILRLALNALHYFSKAYGYYLMVVNHHPESIWIMDSKAKLKKIEKFNTIYTKICENLFGTLRKPQHKLSERTRRRPYQTIPRVKERL